MRHETALAAGLKKAVSHMAAYTLATKLLRKVGGRHNAAPAALKEFLDAIEADADLMRGCALGFLQFVALDMKGGGVGHHGSDTHTIGANAPPPDRDGRGHNGTDAHPPSAPPVREPSTSQKQAMGLARLKMSESVLQSFKVRDGRAIAKVWRSELSDMIGQNYRESMIFDRLGSIKMPDGKNDARVGDYVTDVQMKRIIAEVDAKLAQANAA
jgi:hypothetical protein